MTRALRLVVAQLRISILAALEYRVGFWTNGVVGAMWSLGGLVPLLVALEHREDVAGWTPWQVVLLTGFFLIVSGIYATAIQPAVTTSMGHIRRGSLDYMLLRPVDGLVSCMSAAFQPWSALEILTGVGLVVASCVQLEIVPSLAQLGALAVVLACGLLSILAIGVLILAASFRALELQNLTFLFEALLDFAHWPISIFRGPFKLLFTFVLPFALMTSYPAQSLIGGLGLDQLLGAIASAATLGLLARLSWSRGLRGYTSASS